MTGIRAVSPKKVADTVVIPSPTPLTSPPGVTVAMVVSAEARTGAAPGTGAPVESSTVMLSCTVVSR